MVLREAVLNPTIPEEPQCSQKGFGVSSLLLWITLIYVVPTWGTVLTFIGRLCLVIYKRPSVDECLQLYGSLICVCESWMSRDIPVAKLGGKIFRA